MSRRRSGLNPLSYLGVEPATPPNFVVNDRAPTSTDYYNFNLGTFWLDTSSLPTAPTAMDLYVLVSRVGGVATWIPFAQGATAKLTGDTGGAVSPDGNGNINLLGTASRISVTGNPGTNTLTWDLGATLADTYDADSGSATPVGNTLNVVGGSGISTSGSGSTLTINHDGDLATQYTADSGSASPSAGNINILGGTAVSTSGAGSTITISGAATIATTYTCDAGSATPAANTLNIVGTGLISTSGATDTITITAGTASGVSSFSAVLSANLSNVLGNTTNYYIPFDSTQYDIGSDFDTGGGFFTAPVDGIYFFTATVACNSITSSMTTGSISLVINGGAPTAAEITCDGLNPYPILDNSVGNSEMDFSISGYFNLSAGDFIRVRMALDGAASNTAGITRNTATDIRTWFQGTLITSL